MSSHDIFYEAMLARDYRFDGRFFVGVRTTGIYCRPICPAKPRRENVEFFPSAHAAERAGYRPCLRCRPECAPSSPAWHGTSAIVKRALRLIALNGFFELNEDQFAGQLGVTARHLRRLFIAEVGQTPRQIASNNRLGFARKLIVETDLPMTSVALTAGFSSLRRFNDAFKKRFHRAPTALRGKREKCGSEQGVELSLSYRPPFDWESLLSFYRTHSIAGVENVSDTTYERVFQIGGRTGSVKVGHDSDRSRLMLQVVTDDPGNLFIVAQRIRQMFDLDSDPLLVANCFQAHEVFDDLWKRYPGLRIARSWDPFETAICTILGQLVSVTQAGQMVRQLVEAYGARVRHPMTGSECLLFPSPEKLATCDLDKVKTTRTRKDTIREISSRVTRGEVDLTVPLDLNLLRNQLLSIPGIGPWSTEYICLRGLGDTDAFPGSDLILKRALERHKDIDPERMRPWRSYAAIYLWKHYAELLSKSKGARRK